MKSATLLATVSLALGFASATTVGAREFQDQFGRFINADLVSHIGATGDSVKIRKDGKEMTVKVSVFSDADQKFIRDWMKATPPTLDYAFRVEASKTKEAAGARADNVTYDVKVTNLTRHTVSDLRVEYRAYMMDEGTRGVGRGLRDFANARFGRKAVETAGFGTGEKELKHVEDSIAVKEPMRFNQTLSFRTKPLRLNSGAKTWLSDDFKDKVIGVILRVYDPGGKIVFEHRDTKAKDIEWAKPGEAAEAADRFKIE